MSGIIGSKLNIRGSGRIATLGTDGQVLTSSGAGVAAAFEDAAGGGLDWQAVETGSTMTAVAGNINGLTKTITDIEFELGKLSIFLDEKNNVHMKGPVSEIKEIDIKF